MITAILILLGLAMFALGFWSMSQNDEDINRRFCAEVTAAFVGMAIIGAAIVRAII